MFEGRYVTVARLDARQHAPALWDRIGGEQNAALWRHMWDGPYAERAAFDEALQAKAASPDPVFHAIVDRTGGQAIGYAALMRNEPAHKAIEVGHIVYSPELQRTRGATEAMYLLARHVFEELGYRRYEWKCDAQNEPSRRAALRLGFTFEGIFRQHMIVKGANRDTAWFAMLDSEWPERKREFGRWLRPENFDDSARQKTPLRHF